MDTFLNIALGVFVFIYALAWLLVFLGRLGGSVGKWLAGKCVAAPGLDIVVSLLTWVPWGFGVYLAGWGGVLASVIGQIVGLTLWIWTHEWVNRRHTQGSRIVKSLNGIVGRTRNHLALWASTIVLPVFWLIRLGEILVYPMIRVLLGFPKYKDNQWINVSRQKFAGLVGHDLVWCLYCDWMTGVYSFGAEMLRNVESFWCPIRFSDQNKCQNCQLDFPDIKKGWVKADGTLKEVTDTLEEKYSGTNRSWFGHPSRSSPPPQGDTDPKGVTPADH
ncbi:MAG: hypothetical protein SGI98_06060 [Verrucomicrobiota bacterium]|nr:hypothetical protein [Verrucomicrobiota bacterium]